MWLVLLLFVGVDAFQQQQQQRRLSRSRSFFSAPLRRSTMVVPAGVVRDMSLDFVDTVRATRRYEAESAAISAECATAWKRAWWAMGAVVVMALASVGGARPPGGGAPTFSIAKALVARSLGLVAGVAFSIALRQNAALLGRNGLQSAWKTMRRVHRETWIERVATLPTFGWFAVNVTDGSVDAARFDDIIAASAKAGLCCAAGLFLVGGRWVGGLFGVGILTAQLSISSVGHPFYGYGWESQLAETSFLVSAWLFEVIPGVVAMRWLCFKIMLGAGLIKTRAAASSSGSSSSSRRQRPDCWKDLTAMTLFFETQPMPGPLSRRLHFLPRPAHLFATASNHVIELFAPLLLLLFWLPFHVGSAAARAYGAAHLGFHLTLLASGNLSFLNYLTMIPALACFDDALFLKPGAPPLGLLQGGPQGRLLITAQVVVKAVGAAFVAWLNVPVYRNLFAPSSTRLEGRKKPRQSMNAAFDRVIRLGGDRGLPVNLKALRLANTYGAFGSVTPARDELVVSGSRGEADHWGWREFRFHGPACAQVAPWHLRLDWQKWISTIPGRDATSERWFVAFLDALLRQDPAVTRLLEHNPFSPDDPPTHLRIQRFRYKFAPPPQKKKSGGRGGAATEEKTTTPASSSSSSSSSSSAEKKEEEESGTCWARSLRSTIVHPVGRGEIARALAAFDQPASSFQG